MMRVIQLLVIVCVAIFSFSCAKKDADIENEILAKIKNLQGFQSIKISVKDKVVTLTGEVESESAKNSIQSLAIVDGITAINNYLAIKVPTPTPVPVVQQRPVVKKTPDEFYEKMRRDAEKMIYDNVEKLDKDLEKLNQK